LPLTLPNLGGAPIEKWQPKIKILNTLTLGLADTVRVRQTVRNVRGDSGQRGRPPETPRLRTPLESRA